MRLSFDSIEELKLFYASLKGTRGKKGESDDDGPNTPPAGNLAPPPIQPPAGGFNPQGAQGQTAGFAVPAFNPAPGPQTQQPNPVDDLVKRINARLDQSITSGQPVDAMVGWFREQCTKAGVDANGATLEQIKTACLPKMPIPALEAIAGLMKA